MNLFRCKACEQRDLRIEDLKTQIAFLKSMLQPHPYSRAVNEEANKMLEGASLPAVEIEDFNPSPEAAKHRETVIRQQNQILTGDLIEIE